MTTSQIKTILSEVGNYNTDMIIPLKEVSSILLNIDQNLYPGSTSRFNFSTKNGELLLVYYGREDNGTFIFNNEDIPNVIVPFSTIIGFHMVAPTHVSEPYKVSQAV